MTSLTPDAQALLAKLRVGGNVAQPPAVPGAFAYSSHARAFFNNARGLCEDVGLSDFRVFGALYSLRHGLELMLKCIVRNDRMDDVLRALMKAGLSFDQVCDALQLKKTEKRQLQVSICAIRNILEDRIVAPDCFTKNVDAASAERALQYLRQNPDTDREFFAISWTSTTFGHDLTDLWAKAKPIVESFAGDAKRDAHETGLPVPMTSRDLDPIVELPRRARRRW